MLFKPIAILQIATLSFAPPLFLGQLFNWLNPAPERSSYSNIECGDRYAGATYLTHEQIGYLRSGQYRFWSDIGQPFCRVIREGPSEFYYFPTGFKPELGVIVESDSQAVLLSWDFSIEATAIAPESVPPPPSAADVYAETPAPEQYAAASQQSVDCIPYPSPFNAIK